MIKYTKLFEEFNLGKNYSQEEFKVLCQSVQSGKDNVRLSDRFMGIVKPKVDVMLEIFGGAEPAISAIIEFSQVGGTPESFKDELIVALAVVGNNLAALDYSFEGVEDEDVIFNVLVNKGDVLIDSRKIGFDDKTKEQ